VKYAEDRGGDVVVRLYEALGGHATATVGFGFPVSSARTVDLLEDDLPAGPLAPELSSVGDCLSIRLRPFQIVTLRLTPGESR